MMSGTSYEVVIVYPLLTLPDLKSFCSRLCHLKVCFHSWCFKNFPTYLKLASRNRNINKANIYLRHFWQMLRIIICHSFLHWLWLQVTYLLSFPASKRMQTKRLSLPFGDWLLRLMHKPKPLRTRQIAEFRSSRWVKMCGEEFCAQRTRRQGCNIFGNFVCGTKTVRIYTIKKE